jgi:hypothetical protein
LHLAQDFYAHSNWADYSTGMSLDNPPGLDRVGQVPEGLRFPRNADTVELEPGIINSCDNTMIWNPCTGRVKHDNAISTWSDGINKDLGVIYSDNCWASTDGGHSTDSSRKDPQGRTNFVRAVCSAVNQSKVTWSDFAAQVRGTYGAERGDMIIGIIQTGALPDPPDASPVMTGPTTPDNDVDSSDFLHPFKPFL